MLGRGSGSGVLGASRRFGMQLGLHHVNAVYTDGVTELLFHFGRDLGSLRLRHGIQNFADCQALVPLGVVSVTTESSSLCHRITFHYLDYVLVATIALQTTTV